ncbi:MAG TPA: hypothetical protein VE487_21100 [Ilumatobacter sp.]|nr:hypothetical protein [Ilumatobacter sp.]
MSTPATIVSVALGAAVLALMAGSCSSDGDTQSDATSAETGPVRTVAVPTERLSPFCQSIADLDEQLNAAAPDADTWRIIIDAYSAMVDFVPGEVRNDFLAVLAALQADPAGATVTLATSPGTAVTTPAPSSVASTLEGFEEGYLPDDDSSSRLNAYIQFVCRDSQNNPGPADTEPSLPPPSSTLA